MLDLNALRSLQLRAMVEAAGADDDAKKKKEEEERKKREQEQQQNDNNNDDNDAGDDNPDENQDDTDPQENEPANEEDGQNQNDNTNNENDPPEDENSPEDNPEGTDDAGGEDNPEGEGDAGDDTGLGDDFSMDPDGGDGEGEDDLGPAPDGLPEADATDDGGDAGTDDSEETNVQINILKLSKLDRALAKKTCFQFFMDLKAKIPATLAIIEKNETVIDPDVRDQITDKLNTTQAQLDQFLEYKFPIMNFEEAIQAYYVFVKDINTALEEVRNEGIVGKKSKHKNKESS